MLNPKIKKKFNCHCKFLI